MKTTERYQDLLHLGEVVTSHIQRENLFEAIVEQTCKVMNTERASVFLHDPTQDMLWTLSGSNLENQEIRIPATQGVVGWVFKNSKEVLIPEASTDPRFYGDVDPNFCTRNIIAVPLIDRDGSCIGVLQAINKKDGAFEDREMELLVSASHYVSMALQNSTLITNLREKQASLDAELTGRKQLSQMFVCLVMMIGLYTFFAAGLKMFPAFSSEAKLKQTVSRILEFCFIGGSLGIILVSRRPLAEFGITLRNARRSIIESVLVTIPLLIIPVIAKKYMLENTDFFPEGELVSLKYFNFTYILYLLVAPLQEFIARGVYQGTLQRLIVGKRNCIWAIMLTSLLFGTFHIHQSISLAVLSITMGILWGALFVRHRTLLGISISHFMVGNWVGLLGLWDLMAKY